MKTNEDKLLTELVDSIMKDSILDSPSTDFTSKVMSKALVTKSNKAFVYKSLIPKSVFMLYIVCFVSLMLYLLIDGNNQTNNWLDFSFLNSIYTNQITSLLSFSKITMYAVVLATLMLLMQIVFLKKYFENQFKE